MGEFALGHDQVGTLRGGCYHEVFRVRCGDFDQVVAFAAPLRHLVPRPLVIGLRQLGWLCAVWSLTAALPVSAEPVQPLPIGATIDPFGLSAADGRRWALADVADQPVVVVVFLGTECPLARVYAPRLERLADEYAAQGVTLVGVVSNRQDTPEEIRQFVQDCGVEFPVLYDPDQAVADLFAARRTPEAFVLDQQRTLRYRGRIDDQYGFREQSGYQRLEPSRHDLRDAVAAVLAGDPIDEPANDAPGCLIGRVETPREDAPVTWSNQISRIVQDHCQQCHRPGEIGPFPLVEYDDVLGWERTIQEVVQAGRMPPWGANPAHGEFANDLRLSDDELRAIDRWVADGAPEGDPAELPPPREFLVGWQIAEPDAVYYMDDEPFTVPAEGRVEYQYFTVDPGFTTDRWVKGVECRPGNRAVVHHINVFAAPPELGDDYERDDLTFHMLWAYAPGFQATVFPPGVAARIRAGSRLVFQMHYTASGTVQEDRSSVGLVFASPDEVERQIEWGLAANPFLEIPPHADNHPVEAVYEFEQDMLLYALVPHLHLRGKSFRYEALYRNETTEILLDVPRYDFNWQNSYVFAEPKLMPRGSMLRCVAIYDNSAGNPANPDPSATVRWGDQSWQEMMIGYVHMAPADPLAPTAMADKHLAQLAARRQAQFQLVLRLGGGGAALLGLVALGMFGWRRLRQRESVGVGLP